jgi:hypothetical protein
MASDVLHCQAYSGLRAFLKLSSNVKAGIRESGIGETVTES